MLKPALYLVALALAGGLLAPAASAADITPLPTRNQSPLMQLFGIPAAEDARVVPPGEFGVHLRYDVANDHTTEVRLDENLLWDGETSRVTLVLRRGFGERFEVGVEVPWLAHGGGFLDRLVDNWHDTFNLPDGDRRFRPRNELLYLYEKDGEERLHFERETSGLGDISLTGAWQLSAREGESPHALALRAAVKLPTGDSDDLLGSGSTDVALGLTGEAGSATIHGDFAIFGGLGLLYLVDGDILPGMQRNVAGYGHLGGGWQPLSWLSLLLQVDGHTPLFDDTDLPQLGNVAMQLSAGASFHLPAGYHLDLGISEDVLVSTTPDVAFVVALRRQF